MATSRVAVAQLSPAATTDAAIEKIADFAGRARDAGAELVLFPEAFVGGYPRGSGFGAIVVERVSFADHAAFSDADGDRLMALAERHDARLITTAKDHVRLEGSAKLEALALATATLPVAMTLADEDRNVLSRMLDGVLGASREGLPPFNPLEG